MLIIVDAMTERDELGRAVDDVNPLSALVNSLTDIALGALRELGAAARDDRGSLPDGPGGRRLDLTVAAPVMLRRREPRRHIRAQHEDGAE